MINSEAIQNTVNYIRTQSKIIPKIGIILGSGLGNVADTVCEKEKAIIPFSRIPHFPKPTVVGHQGNLILAECQHQSVAIMQGRFHLYEGHPVETIIYPIQVLAKLGVKLLILTNAAGGLNPKNPVGSFVVIKDQINFMFRETSTSNSTELNRIQIYDSTLIEQAIKLAKKEKIPIATGVYIGALGPTYETPAEVRMFQKMGGDMIGMSTVLESIAATQLGMKVLGISCITNMTAGISPVKLDHQEVIEITRKTSYNLSKLLVALISEL
ncbi:MAG: purine-nucleoside phosphorylase [bacterium]